MDLAKFKLFRMGLNPSPWEHPVKENCEFKGVILDKQGKGED